MALNQIGFTRGEQIRSSDDLLIESAFVAFYDPAARVKNVGAGTDL